VRTRELGHVAHLHLESHLNRAARGALARGHFGLESIKRRVRRAGYAPRRHDGKAVRIKVASADPVLIGEGVTPLQIGDDVLWHDAAVFAPPYRDIGIALKGHVFFVISAVRPR
jgi:hypothetical protein